MYTTQIRIALITAAFAGLSACESLQVERSPAQPKAVAETPVSSNSEPQARLVPASLPEVKDARTSQAKTCKLSSRSSAANSFNSCYGKSIGAENADCRLYNFDFDGDVDFDDLILKAQGAASLNEWCGCPGDFTNDGHVDAADNRALANCYNQDVTDANRTLCESVDQTGDGKVDFDELLRMGQNYNSACTGD